MIILIKFLQLIFRIIFYGPANVALRIMHSAGWLLQTIAKKTRFKRTVIKNIKMVLPQSPANQIANKLIENTSYSIFEMLCVPFFKKEHFKKVVSWQGDHRINESLAKGCGVIILTMHAGNYELIPMTLAKRGYKITTVLRATKDPLFTVVNRSRSAGGVKLINVLDEDMYKEALKVLNKNQMLFLLADTGALDSRHIFIDFLGKKVPAATGWLTLAQRSDAVVIPTLCKKEGTKNTIVMLEPIRVTKETREQATQEAAKSFEAYIEHNPEQWAIFLNSLEIQRMVTAEEKSEQKH